MTMELVSHFGWILARLQNRDPAGVARTNKVSFVTTSLSASLPPVLLIPYSLTLPIMD
jgi:hypothetical protein